MKWALVWLCAAVPLAAQGPTDGVGTAARTGFVFDGYYFGASYAFDHVVEWTLPVGLSHRLGSHITVDLSSGYAHAAAATTSGTLEVSGATDTDVRMSWAGASGHVIVSVAGTLPTGKKAVDSSAVPLLSALATEGRELPLAREIYPRGGERRSRAGRRGPRAARRGGTGGRPGYFRGAAVYATSGADTLGAGARSASGPRFLVYSGLSLPAGRSSLSLYAYDRYRLQPHGYDSTVVQVPRGNVLALGARLDRPLSPALSLAPNVEFRHELAGPATGRLALLGWLVRPGVDVRYRASGTLTVLVQGQAAFGRLAGGGGSVSLVGPRAVVLLEWAQ